MMNQRKNAANIITSCRIVFSVVLLFCSPLSPSFFAFYLLAGFTDMIDGTVARKTGSVSRFGSVLDTLADFVFVSVCLIKLLPVLNAGKWIYIPVITIALIKLINLVLGLCLYGKYVSVHSLMNKITGVFLFIIPLTLPFVDVRFSVPAVSLIAVFSAVQEGFYIVKRKETE